MSLLLRTFLLATTLLTLGGCAMSRPGSYVLEPHQGMRRIDPAEVAGDRESYRLSRRDVLLIQINPLEQADERTRIDRGNHLNLGLELTPASASTYRLLAGDELTLDMGDDADHVFEARVGPDGNLVLPRAGRSVRAEGLTVAELDAAATKQYAGLYLAPKPSWSVRRSAADAIAARSGEYPVGSDGAIVVPTVGRFVVLGKTVDEAAALIGAQAGTRFRNPVTASVSLAVVNRREQIDLRLTPNGMAMFSNTANVPIRVSDEGTIYVPGVGQVLAMGRTVGQLRDLIADIAGRNYQNPVIVNVSTLDSLNDALFIGGEVKAPGRFPYAERTSLLKLIAQAGWGTEYADFESILLLREVRANSYVVYRTNLQEVMDGTGPGAQDFRLTPQDLVIVPPTGIAKANRFVTQYLRGILPFGTSLSYSINRGLSVNP